MTAKEFFESLIGLDISEARKRLGFWWSGEYANLSLDGSAYYGFYRSAGGRVELHTENNTVVSEHHNAIAEIYQKNDLK